MVEITSEEQNKVQRMKRTEDRNAYPWRLNNMFLNNQQVTEEIKREIKKFLETNDNENMTTKNLRDAAKAVLKRKFIAFTILPQVTRKTLTRQPNVTPKTTGKRRRKIPQN